MSERYDPRITPWSFDDDDFHELESRREQIEFLLRYAVLAPSSHNQQPWSFQITQEGVAVFADSRRRLPIIDPDDRELTLSIGAAIANLRVAAAHFGFESTLQLPASAEGGAVATLTLRETSGPDEKLRSLFRAIKRRHTNRTPFNDESIEPEALATLLDVVEDYPQTFHLVFRQDQRRAADLIAFADQLLMADDAYRCELAGCVHPADRSDDGLAADTLGIPAPLAFAAPFVIRHFDVGNLQAHHDRELTMSATALLVVSAEDDPISLLRAGEALEYLLLTITKVGLEYSFLNAPIQRADLRDRIRILTGATRPSQLIVRIGHGPPMTSSSPRRPLAAVLMQP